MSSLMEVNRGGAGTGPRIAKVSTGRSSVALLDDLSTPAEVLRIVAKGYSTRPFT